MLSLQKGLRSHRQSGLLRCSLIAAAGCLLFAAFAAPTQAVVYQAENYTNYFDTTAGNSGGAFRNDGVDSGVV